MSLYLEDGSTYEPEFSEPEDWRQEEPDSIEGTRQLYDVIFDLVARGFGADLIDVWSGEESEQFVLEVDLSVVNRDTFRMFEDHLIRFSKSSS